MNGEKNQLSGECLCGAVRFEISGSLSHPNACHCNQCRRQTGHYIVTTHVERSGLSLTEKRGLKWYGSSEIAERGFCAECGSTLFWDDGGKDVYITVGSLNQPTGLTLAKHKFVDEKGDYYEIGDDLPQFPSTG